MTLYEFIKVAKNDYDTYDTDFDACVTVCSFDEKDEKSEEYYEQFRIGIMKFVEVDHGISSNELCCKWTEMIKDNLRVFGEFMQKYWVNQYDDEDDFIYEWINELHNWIAGELSEGMYKIFVTEYMPKLEYLGGD